MFRTNLHTYSVTGAKLAALFLLRTRRATDHLIKVLKNPFSHEIAAFCHIYKVCKTVAVTRNKSSFERWSVLKCIREIAVMSWIMSSTEKL